MIQNLELERQRIEEALEVLRRLHQIRNAPVLPLGVPAGPEETAVAPESAVRPKRGKRTTRRRVNGLSQE
jgi:hypothetical protein